MCLFVFFHPRPSPAPDDYIVELFDNGECPLQWWKEHARLLPYLSRLAYRYLAMPATSAPVERLFSVTGQVVTAKRASVDPHTVTFLVFLHETLPVLREMTVRQIIKEMIVV